MGDIYVSFVEAGKLHGWFSQENRGFWEALVGIEKTKKLPLFKYVEGII